MRTMPQPSQRSTWPPSAAVRHASMAAMTRRCAAKMAGRAARQAAPWRRKMSATSSAGRTVAALSLAASPPAAADPAGSACRRSGAVATWV